MPLTAKGKRIKSEMIKQYGKDRGTEIFHRAERAGTIKGVSLPYNNKKRKKTK